MDRSRVMSDNKGGRPTKYDPKLNGMVEELCRLGVTDKEMADFFEVSVSTFYRWKLEHKDFSEAIRRGRILFEEEMWRQIEA